MSFVRDGPVPLSGADLDSIAGDSGPARGLALDPTCSRAIPFKTHCLRTQRKKDVKTLRSEVRFEGRCAHFSLDPLVSSGEKGFTRVNSSWFGFCVIDG